MLRVLLPPSQPGRRQFQYSLPALFCNAAGDDDPGAAVGSTPTVGGHQDNTVWVKPQRVAAWHAQLRLKLSPDAAAGGSSPGSPSSSPASPSPRAVKLQVRCLAPASVSGSSGSLTWEIARSGMWRELPLKKWCTLHEGDALLLGAGSQALADSQQGHNDLAGCCLLQVAGLRELRKWALQQARLRLQPQPQQTSPGLVARHGAFASLVATAQAQQHGAFAVLVADAEAEQVQQQRAMAHVQQTGAPPVQPAEQQQQPRQPQQQLQSLQQQPQSQRQQQSQQRQSDSSNHNPPAAKKQRRADGQRLQEPFLQHPRSTQLPSVQQQAQHQQRPQQSTGRSGGLASAAADRLAAPQRRLDVVQELLDSVQKLAGAGGQEAQRAVQLVQQAVQRLSQEGQDQPQQGTGSGPSAPASPSSSSSSDAETLQLPVARHLPFASPPSLAQQAQQQLQQRHEEAQQPAASGWATATVQQAQPRSRVQPERSAGSSPSGPEPEWRQPVEQRTAAAAAAVTHPQQATTRAAAAARNAGATASTGAAPSAGEPAALRQQQQPPPQQQQQQQAARAQQLEPVQDVQAELKRLGKRYTGSDPTRGIRLRVKQDTLDRLRRIAQQAPDLPCFATVKPQWGLRRLLAEGFRPAQLCKRAGAAALVGEALTLRTTCRLKKDDACGWLSGVLTEAGGRKSSSFTSSEYFIPRERLDELAREFGAEYGGEDLMLEMEWETNEFGFLQDTLFREVDEECSPVNVKPFVALLHSTAEGLAVPLPVVYATRAIKPGEELVADGMDELDEQDLLLDALASRLIASGWRCHLLDTFWLRLARLAQQRCRQLAASSRTAGAAHRLRLALKGAVRLYYGQQPSSSSGNEAARGGAASRSSPHGSSGGDGGGSGGGGGSVPAEVLQLLDAALSASTRAYRPPCSATSLSHREAPPLDQQFRPLARRELPPLCRASDFSGLPPQVLGALDGAPDGQPLEESVRQRLRRGDVPAAAVCEIRYRLHRVRLLTPPGCAAHSLNTAPGAARLAAGDCVGVYIGRVVTADVAEEESHDSAYLYDIKARQVGPHLLRGQAWAYDGPDLVVDASQLRNELAFANDVFGAAPSTRPSLYTQVIWDPDTKRPALKMSYVLRWRAKPLQELLLSYGDSYWPVEGPKLRRKHEAYAARAAQAIAAVHAALESTGAAPADLAACLAPVDLAAGEHRFYEVFSLE